MRIIKAIANSVAVKTTIKRGTKYSLAVITADRGRLIALWTAAGPPSPTIESIKVGETLIVGLDDEGNYSLVWPPVNPIVGPIAAPPAHKPGWLDLPLEAEMMLRSQIREKEVQQVPTPPLSPGVQARMAELAAIYYQALAIANGCQIGAAEIFSATVATQYGSTGSTGSPIARDGHSRIANA